MSEREQNAAIGTRLRTTDGLVGTSVAVGYSRGVLCVWLDVRPAVPVEQIAGRS